MKARILLYSFFSLYFVLACSKEESSNESEQDINYFVERCQEENTTQFFEKQQFIHPLKSDIPSITFTFSSFNWYFTYQAVNKNGTLTRRDSFSKLDRSGETPSFTLTNCMNGETGHFVVDSIYTDTLDAKEWERMNAIIKTFGLKEYQVDTTTNKINIDGSYFHFYYNDGNEIIERESASAGKTDSLLLLAKEVFNLNIESDMIRR